MESSKYKLLITTSGTGSRLKNLTQHTNKALIEINGKATLSYILDKYPKNIPLVITIGYLANQIKAFMKTHHPERDIEWITIDKYEGLGTSLGYSILQAEKALQCPFIFHACDTIITEDIPAPDTNFAIGWIPPQGMDCNQYRTHTVKNNQLTQLNEKGVTNFDAVHIGITGIKNYKEFWNTLNKLYESDPEDTGWSDVHVIEEMIQNNVPFVSIPVTEWLDTGNPEALQKTEEYFKQKTK